MCISLTKNGLQCKLSPNKIYCHKHQNPEQQPLKNFTNELQVEVNELKNKLFDKEKTIERLILQVRSYKDQNKKLSSSVIEMEDYYQKYKQILEFERYKLSISHINQTDQQVQRYNS